MSCIGKMRKGDKKKNKYVRTKTLSQLLTTLKTDSWVTQRETVSRRQIQRPPTVLTIHTPILQTANTTPIPRRKAIRERRADERKEHGRTEERGNIDQRFVILLHEVYIVATFG